MSWIIRILNLFSDNKLKVQHTKDVTMSNEVNEKNARHAFEFLALINEAKTEDDQIILLKKWGGIVPLSMLLSLNFNSKLKLDFPSGAPPYNRDETIHPDMATPLSGQIQRLKACVPNNGIKRMDKERVLLQVLEQISFKEADVLIACKDKALNEMFPNIKAETVKKCFPSYVD